jgi:uncharacterized damage-inducible protein DinB
MVDRKTPYTFADEKTTLKDFIDYLRESVIIKVQGLSDEDARRELVPSGTSLMWLLKHLRDVETWWFQYLFLGLDVEFPDDDVKPDDTVEEAITTYREAIAHSNEIIAECEDLDIRAARAGRAPEPVTMRWLLVHMVEEIGRHAGHADILREQIDGATGR